MKGHVLIIEDEQELAELIQLFLSNEGIESSWAASAEKGMTMVSEKVFDLIVLDINLPGMDGFEFLQHIRKHKSIPVIIVSARSADEDVIMGLGIGADEFVTKPFKPRVLTARIRALLRRSTVFSDEKRLTYSFGDYVLDYEGYLLKKDEKPITLSTKEFDVLRFLVKNAGHMFTPEKIYQAVWEQEYGEFTTVAVYIQRLRKKIEDDYRNPRYLKTIRGRGYRFEKEVLQ
jgi:DNA-binding response OmpR family regulator